MERLKPYRDKRSGDRTPEPFGGESSGGARRFVVQHHAARRIHYDLRLEWNGVLWSWAVPKGPSPNPADKRLAVHTEDHPLDYADFEGVIPAGNYGAGSSIVWDRGTWTPLADPDEGLDKGKLLFELNGYKLRGKWTLVRTKQDWLFIKERDRHVSEGGTEDFPQDSILSGLTVADLARGERKVERVRALVEKQRAPRKPVKAKTVKLMLAVPRKQPFSDPDWLFEVKYDGYRLLASRHHGVSALRSRAGHDLTAVFPEIAQSVSALPFEDFLADGEVVVHDADGLPSFSRLSRRGKLTRRADIRRASVELPASLYLFDLLAFTDFDLRGLPLEARKTLLKQLLPSVGPLRFSDHVHEHGEALFEQAQAMRLEGIVAKAADSRYEGRRSTQWIKITAARTDDFAIVGYTEIKGANALGAVHLAQRLEARWVYCGRVGSGFSDRQRDELAEALSSRRVERPVCDVPEGTPGFWVAPEQVCEVRFKELTDDGLIRQGVFLRVRDDKPADECIRARPKADLDTAPSASIESAERHVAFSNLDKVFWPAEGHTKGDLIDYYRDISPWLLPYLRDRPVVLTRYPDGIDGKSFFQKDAPSFVPDWIRLERLWSEGSEREIGYFVVDDVESLLYIINMGTIPLHVWSSRTASLEQPDWCILDLDPKETPFVHVVTVARAIHRLCTAIGLPSYVKTSGSTGLHVLVPLAGQLTYEQSRTLGELLARVVVAQHPDIATIVRRPESRGPRVYIDYVQNGHGRLLAAPFCVRPLPGAPVAMPLTWREVNPRLDIRRFNIDNAATRMRKKKGDPLLPVLSEKPDVGAALVELSARYRDA